MILGKLKDVLDNIGPGIHDVCYCDSDGLGLNENDLSQHDFDTIDVIGKHIDEKSKDTNWVILNITLAIKKQPN
jgi:hypothetical protein